METVAEENPLRSATSRIVTAALRERLRAGSGRSPAASDVVFDGFESVDPMDTLIFELLLADTTGR
jgi:hypothetical protein